MSTNLNPAPRASARPVAEEEEYVFRFPLSRRKPHPDPDQVMAELFRDQLRELLKVVFLGRDGTRLMPTEFGFLDNPQQLYRLWETRAHAAGNASVQPEPKEKTDD